jgi:hypothetical protein
LSRLHRWLLWAIYWPLEVITLSLWRVSFELLGVSNWFGEHALHFYKELEPVAVEWRFQQMLRQLEEMREVEKSKGEKPCAS